MIAPKLDLAIRRLIAMGVYKDGWCWDKTLHAIGISPDCCQEFILLVLLVSFLKMPWQNTSSLDILDLFAGKARISKLGAWLGYRTRAFDISYHPTRHPFVSKRGLRPRSCMDINGAAGFACLCIDSFFNMYPQQNVPE